MLKVIIIDDEAITRKGLVEFINWSKFNMRVVGQAGNGLEALKLAEEVQPDLAICDIRMPHMNGIEFATQIKYIAKNCKIIFLSGYTDKEYLKSAIKLNVVDYIEKPVNLEEMSKLLLKVNQIYKKEHEQSQHKNQLMEKFNRSKQHIINSIMKNFINEEYFELKIIENMLKEIGVDFPLNSEYQIAVITDYKEFHAQKIMESLFTLFKEILHLPVLVAEVNQEILILHSSTLKDDDVLKQYNNYFLKNKTEFDLDVEAGLGHKVIGVRNIHLSYTNAKDAINWNGFKNKNEIIIFEKDQSTLGIIRDTEQYISQHYDDDIVIKDIADAVFLTPQYLCKVYKSETGKTINNHITDLRMVKSKELLKNRNFKLYEVAKKIGYKDSNYFARVFKKYYGLTPSEYREKNHV